MLSDVINFLYIFVFLVPFNILRYYPFRNKIRFPLKVMLTFYIVLFLTESAVFCYIARQPFWEPSVTQRYQLAVSAFNSTLSFLLIKEKLFKQMFITGFLFSVAGFTMTNANFVERLIFAEIPNPYTYSFASIMSVLQILIIFPFLIKLMKTNMIPALRIASDKSWNIVWVILLFFYGGTFLSTYNLGFERSSNISEFFIRVFCFGSIIGICIIFSVALKQTAENVSLLEKATMIQRQLAMENTHYATISRHIEETKAARHDLRHHLALIQAYVDSGNNKKLKEYINQYIESVPEDTVITLCKNYAVNSITHYYMDQARAENIETDIHITLPEVIGIADSDLCIVFGNLLENAVEACRSSKASNLFIAVSATLAGNYVVIAVDNSFEGDIRRDKDVFLSSKHNGKGIGITSVQAVAEKYSGQTKFDYFDNVFRASVMLRLLE